MTSAAYLARLLRACVRGTTCLATCLFLLAAAHASNPIQIENAKPGTTDWQITKLAFNHEIEGYASATSVNRGGQISLFVNTGAPSYTLEVFRMGWYGGTGGRRMTAAIQIAGTQQPAPTTDPLTGLNECAWTNPYVLNIPNNSSDPSDWASGVYLVKLAASDSGRQRYIIFVVRDDARASDYLFNTSAMTYQAYNNWGGKSLYAFNSTGGPARKVSFNRPYEQSVYASPDGAGHFLGGWEYNMVRFLEREGYDVSYGSDLDVHENINLLLSHKAFLVVGHDEYWSWEMRSNVVAARDQGVSLGFFAANTCYWQVRFEPSLITGAPDRTIVAYKAFSYTEDPFYLDTDPSNDHLVTVRWREFPVNMPEDAFVGVMYESDPVNADIVVADASNWAFATTGLNNGDSLPGLLGYEVDREFDNTPPGTVLLGHSPYPFSGTTRYSDMTVYTAASGSTVFATGSMQWSWGLDDYNAPVLHTSRLNPAAQQITRNVLARLNSNLPPLADPGGPYSGAAGQAIQFNGNGSSDPDGVVMAYEWDFGDGATGTGSIATHAYDAAGTYTVTLVVTDDKGSRNSATTTATMTAPTPAVSLSSSSLRFSNQLVGTTSAAQSVTLTNPGGASLTINSIVASGDFARTTTCAASLPAGASCTISVTFTPTATGERSGTIDITDNAVGSPHQVSLSGTGTASAVGLSPTSLSFATEAGQPVGTTSDSQTVTLTNVGSATLNITSIAASGDFARTNNCGTSLAAGASCTISVTFSPTAAGTRSGAVTITDDAAGSPHAVDLVGTGTIPPAPAVNLSPGSLSFGDQPLGETSASQTVTLTNTGGSGLNISSITASGDFARTNSCPALLGPNASCSIQVTFTPTAIATRSGQVSVTSDASGSPHAVNLSGVGADFAVGASPGSVTIARGQSAVYTVTVTAMGGSFQRDVSLSCLNLPAFARCTFSQNPVNPGSGAMNSTLTISTTPSASLTGPLPNSGVPVYAMAILAAGLVLGAPAPGARRRRQRTHLGSVAMLALVLVLGACGGGGGSTPTPAPRPTTSFNIAIAGAYGNLQHTTFVTLTVD